MGKNCLPDFWTPGMAGEFQDEEGDISLVVSDSSTYYWKKHNSA